MPKDEEEKAPSVEPTEDETKANEKQIKKDLRDKLKEVLKGLDFDRFVETFGG